VISPAAKRAPPRASPAGGDGSHKRAGRTPSARIRRPCP
jgi:hypothetical protein